MNIDKEKKQEACDCDSGFPRESGLEQHYDNCWTKWDGHEDNYTRYTNGSIRLLNPHLLSSESQKEVDVLYHIGFDSKNDDLPAMFGDVKFVCMGGTKCRMRDLAAYMTEVLNYPPPEKLVNLTKYSHRYAMYKVGPVLSVSHGIGVPSMSILLQEVIKLLYYAKAKDPIFFRVGTSGGIGVPAGSVVVSSWGLNGCLEKSYEIPILGVMHKFPSYFDKRLVQEVMLMTTPEDEFEVHSGGTMCADDFYRGQARLDGPFCHYTESEKMAFLKRLSDLGVKNIEMEATAFAAYCKEAGIRAVDVCVTFVNRLKEDQVTASPETMSQWQKRPMVLLGRYIKKYLTEKQNKHS